MPADGVLIGRDGLLADLRDWFGPAAYGTGRSALLLGEAGAGKSSVAEALAAMLAANGFRVARGWCSAAAMPPYWPWRRALAKVAPALPFDPAGASDYDRQVLFTAVIDALERQDKPLLIVLEDLHWAGASSLALLRAAIAAPVALLCTRRDEAGENLLTDLPTDVRRVAVPPLDDAAAATLVTRIAGQALPPKAVAEAVAEAVSRAGGNPFFLCEVARLLAAHGPSAMAVVPPGVHEVLARRVARLTQSCAALLAVTAITAETTPGGRDLIDEKLVGAVAGLPTEAVTDLLDEAIRAGLVAADDQPRFAHALVREVLVADLPRVEAGRLHRRVAEALGADAAAVPRPSPNTTKPATTGSAASDAERLAHHWSRASGADAAAWAAAWSVRAADAAVDALGFDQVVEHLRRALEYAGHGAAAPSHGGGALGPGGDVPDRVDVLIRLGRAQRLAGDLGGSRESFDTAVTLANNAGRSDDLALAALGIGGGVIGFEVPIAEVAYVETLRRALTGQPEGDSSLRAALLGRLSLALTGLAGPGERRRLAQQAVEMAERCGEQETIAGVVAAYCDAVAGPEHVTARLAAADRMLAVSAGREPALLARRLRVLAYFERGDLSAVDAEIAAYRRAAGVAGIPLYSMAAGDLARFASPAARRYRCRARPCGGRRGHRCQGRQRQRRSTWLDAADARPADGGKAGRGRGRGPWCAGHGRGRALAGDLPGGSRGHLAGGRR